MWQVCLAQMRMRGRGEGEESGVWHEKGGEAKRKKCDMGRKVCLTQARDVYRGRKEGEPCTRESEGVCTGKGSKVWHMGGEMCPAHV